MSGVVVDYPNKYIIELEYCPDLMGARYTKQIQSEKSVYLSLTSLQNYGLRLRYGI